VGQAAQLAGAVGIQVSALRALGAAVGVAICALRAVVHATLGNAPLARPGPGAVQRTTCTAHYSVVGGTLSAHVGRRAPQAVCRQRILAVAARCAPHSVVLGAGGACHFPVLQCALGAVGGALQAGRWSGRARGGARWCYAVLLVLMSSTSAGHRHA